MLKIAYATFLLAGVCGPALASSALASDVSSVSRISFGPSDTLFVADWKQAKVHAFHLGPAASDQDRQFNVTNLNPTLAKIVGDPDPAIEDMAVAEYAVACAESGRSLSFTNDPFLRWRRDGNE